MAYELIYTSAERGLRAGTQGYCTVAHTRGMSPQKIQLLEAISSYKSLYRAQEAAAREEPVSWSHLRCHLLGRSMSVLSRISAAGVDHTSRSNKLAHHLLIETCERPAGGPLWLSMQEGLFHDGWNDEPHLLETPPVIPQGDETEFFPSAWKELTGDAGNAGVLASFFHDYGDNPVLLVYDLGMDVYALLREAMALLPATERWNVTYNTYFTALTAGTTCAWRCCVADSEACREARRNPNIMVMDLTQALPEPRGEDEWVRRAREGLGPEAIISSAAKADDGRYRLSRQRDVNPLNLKPRRY